MKSQSFKFMVILLAICSAIGIGILIDSTIKNNSVIVAKNKNEEIIKQQLKEKEIKKQQQINQKQKNLEKLWKKGYDEFFVEKYKLAIETENQVIKEDPTFYKSYAVKGIALAYNGNFEKGMQQIDQSLKLNPNYGYARFNKALAYELYEHYDEAIIWYKKDLEVEKFEWSYYGIASIYGRKGDVNNTVKYLKLAIVINPSVKNNAKNEKDFDNVRNHMEFNELIK